MNDLSADELLRRWQEHDDLGALDELLRREVAGLKDALRSRVGGLLRPSLGATDAAQEAVLALLKVQVPPHFEHERAFRAYLWTAASRLLRRHVERHPRHALSLDRMGTDSDHAPTLADAHQRTLGLEVERSEVIAFAMDLLDPIDREILDLVYLNQMDIDGAANRLGTSKAAVNMRLVRARRALAEKLAGWNDLIGG